MRGFARHFRIRGIAGFGPREFMQRAKLEVLKLMRENRGTRVLIILNCEMIREELFNVLQWIPFKKEFTILIKEEANGDFTE